MKFEKYIKVKLNNLEKSNLDEYFTICKRDKNKKRDFIIVQNYLGKHVPKHPSEIIKYYEELRKLIIHDNKFSKITKSEKLDGIIYFAETALAIGEYLEKNLKIDYAMHTTREKKPYKKIFMKLTEDHCHAPEHIIYGDKNKVKKLDRILIVDDEITSGNTTEKVINEIQKINPKCEIFIASFINLMKPERMLDFFNKGINIISLVKGDIINENRKIPINENVPAYIKEDNLDSYLILGTEENMYEALMCALELENRGYSVYFHASTRSPIVPSNEANYSLKSRYDFPSAKDCNREVYIYNLNNYKQIFVFRNDKTNSFDTISNTLLEEFSQLPIKFYNYKEEN